MRIIPLFIFVCCVFPSFVYAYTKDGATELKAPLKVNVAIEDAVKRIIQLLNQPEPFQLNNEFSLQVLVNLAENDAEQYLVSLIEGALLINEQKYELAIEHLENTKNLANKLPKSQMNGATFRVLHHLLEHSYIKVDDYDHAFREKKKFITRMFDDNEDSNKKMNKVLEQKFQLEQKNKAKQLLEDQSRLKKLQILEAEQKKSDNERDAIILLSIVVIFILLMLRQLNIRRRLLWLTQIDSLTSLKNRTRLFEEGEVMFAQAKSDNKPLSLILLDIDHFKTINDTFGHSAGDNALIHVAKLGQEVMRSRDVFARLGGEEFVALLPEVTLDDAKAIAVRLKDKIDQADFYSSGYSGKEKQGEGQMFHLTVSIGLIQYQPEIEKFDQLIKLAGDAMYLAKARGRNQVVTATELYPDKVSES